MPEAKRARRRRDLDRKKRRVAYIRQVIHWTHHDAEPLPPIALGIQAAVHCCGCSCWMCGHQRKWFGPRFSELRAMKIQRIRRRGEVFDTGKRKRPASRYAGLASLRFQECGNTISAVPRQCSRLAASGQYLSQRSIRLMASCNCRYSSCETMIVPSAFLRAKRTSIKSNASLGRAPDPSCVMTLQMSSGLPSSGRSRSATIHSNRSNRELR